MLDIYEANWAYHDRARRTRTYTTWMRRTRTYTTWTRRARRFSSWTRRRGWIISYMNLGQGDGSSNKQDQY